MSRRDPNIWSAERRLQWQIDWHRRQIGRANYWLEWAYLPEEHLNHWKFIRKVHECELMRLLGRM